MRRIVLRGADALRRDDRPAGCAASGAGRRSAVLDARGYRRTTISTVGWLPGLRRFVDEVEEPIRLALSLHAADPSLRSRLMLAGVNDRVEQARQLAELLDAKVFKVNLIPYNPTGMFEGSSRKAIDAFRKTLTRGGLPATVRLTRGRDIEAACGQLAASG